MKRRWYCSVRKDAQYKANVFLKEKRLLGGPLTQFSTAPRHDEHLVITHHRGKEINRWIPTTAHRLTGSPLAQSPLTSLSRFPFHSP